MVDWTSSAELVLDGQVFVKLMHALTGVYVWEWFLSIDFDWDFITLKKRFRWPMIFYFANRYLLLFALIGILISFDSTTPLNCQALYTFIQLAGNAAVGLASINLSLRTIAVYGNSKPLTIFLIIVILGHWSLILQGVLLTAEWNQEAEECEITSTNNTVLAATFIYSMSFDLIVFLLNAYKLYVRRGKEGAMGESRLGRMIFGDGLVYFFIAFLSNVLATVFMLLNLNTVMTVIFNVPAAISSTIVACRVVRRLSNFRNEGAEIYTGSGSGSGLQFRGHSTRRMVSAVRRSAATSVPTGGVHVQMETFTRAEDFVQTPTSPTGQGLSIHVHYASDSELKQNEGSDTEFGEDVTEAKAAAL